MLKLCEVCDNKDIKKVLSLGKHPLCDDLIPINSKKKSLLYKIEILYCINCFTAHQKYQVKKKKLFPKQYHYRARLTNDVINGMKSLVENTKKYLGNLKNKTVLDVGCNDGSLLDIFYNEGCNTIGVEPTNASKDANTNKHKILNEYFTLSTIKKIKKKIDIITFTNVFAHIENLPSLINTLKKIVSDKTSIVIENHYLGSILKKNQFDTFYHEHPRTYSFKSFIFIARKLNMKIFAVEFPKRYGGNIRIFLRKKEKNLPKNYKKIIEQEKTFFKKFFKMKKIIKKWQLKKKKEINRLFLRYGKIPAKAFPGRAAILIKMLDLNEKVISAVYEKPNSKKIGNYVPGTRIPIYSDLTFFNKVENSKVIINLAWHIKKEIFSYLKKNKYKGKIINIFD